MNAILKISCLFWIQLAASGMAQGIVELDASDDGTASRIWHANNRSFEQLSERVSDLYVSLYNGGALPVTKIAVNEGDTPSEIMVDKGYFHGSYFPLKLDALLCDLNPYSCSRNRRPIDVGEDSHAPIAHIAFTVPERGTWSIKPGDELLVPALEFSKFIDYTAHNVSSSNRLEKIVTDHTRGCESFDDACRKKILSQNRLVDGVFDENFVGKLYLPTYSLRANLSAKSYLQINLDLAKDMPVGITALLTEQYFPDDGTNLPALIEDLEKTTGKLINTLEVKSGEQAEALGPGTSNEIIDRAINLPGGISGSVNAPWSKVFRFSVPDNVATIVRNIHAYHNYPYSSPNDIPDDLAGRINVAVVDEHFSDDPCGFSQRFQILRQQGNGQLISVVNNNCSGTMEFDPTGKVGRFEHGTHVAGIIGSFFEGMVFGGNPYAHILGVEIPVSNANVIAEQEQLVARLALADDQIEPVVYNLSIGYPRNKNVGGSADRLIEFMEKKENAALFVVAAGNGPNNGDGADLQHGCDIRPACASLPNVLTVVAASASGNNVQRARYSNFNTNHFHIAAIGTDVPSIVSGSQLRMTSGTSQATPHVAAAASLLMKRFRILPSRAKQRIIACSNVEHGLIGGIGGLLDVSCIVNGDTDLIVRNGIENRGRVVRLEPARLAFDRVDGGPEAVFSSDGILAIGKHDNEFIVFTTTGRDDITSVSGLIPSQQDAGAIIKFKDKSNNILDIPLSEIDRWVKRLN